MLNKILVGLGLKRGRAKYGYSYFVALYIFAKRSGTNPDRYMGYYEDNAELSNGHYNSGNYFQTPEEATKAAIKGDKKGHIY